MQDVIMSNKIPVVNFLLKFFSVIPAKVGIYQNSLISTNKMLKNPIYFIISEVRFTDGTSTEVSGVYEFKADRAIETLTIEDFRAFLDEIQNQVLDALRNRSESRYVLKVSFVTINRLN